KGKKAFDFVNLRSARIRVQLDRAAPRFLPFLIEIQKKIYPAVQHSALIDIEVDVHVKALAILVVMGTAAEQRFIGKEIGNARQAAHRGEERSRVDVIEELAIKSADGRNIFHHRFSAGAAVFIGRTFFVE